MRNSGFHLVENCLNKQVIVSCITWLQHNQVINTSNTINTSLLCHVLHDTIKTMDGLDWLSPGDRRYRVDVSSHLTISVKINQNYGNAVKYRAPHSANKTASVTPLFTYLWPWSPASPSKLTTYKFCQQSGNYRESHHTNNQINVTPQSIFRRI